VYHFAEQEDALARVLLNGTESNVNGILHAITKTEMTGQVNPQWTKVEQGR
jgi:hypothetical protein